MNNDNNTPNNEDKPKVIRFPDGTTDDLSHNDDIPEDILTRLTSDEMGGINPKQIVPQFGLPPEDVTKNKPLSQVVEDLVDSEVKRMSGNLDFLNKVEGVLKTEIKSRIDSGTIDMDTLFDAMDAFGKSVDRSDRIIKQKNSPLVNILIDNRKNVQGNEVNVGVDEDSKLDESLDGRSRKRLTSLISALLSASTKGDEIVVDNYTEVPEDED